MQRPLVSSSGREEARLGSRQAAGRARLLAVCRGERARCIYLSLTENECLILASSRLACLVDGHVHCPLIAVLSLFLSPLDGDCAETCQFGRRFPGAHACFRHLRLLAAAPDPHSERSCTAALIRPVDASPDPGQSLVGRAKSPREHGRVAATIRMLDQASRWITAKQLSGQRSPTGASQGVAPRTCPAIVP